MGRFCLGKIGMSNLNKLTALIFIFTSLSSTANSDYVIRVPKELSIGEWQFEKAEVSDWAVSSEAYNCSLWLPSESEIDEGIEFSQEQSCSYDMERKVLQYKVNSVTGDRLLESEKTEYKTELVSEFRDSIGSKISRNLCVDILNRGESLGDGVYTVDPDGAGGEASRNAYCDMAGGGWTLFDSFGTKLLKTGGSNPSSYNQTNINSSTGLRAAGYDYYLTTINTSYYHTSPYYMQFFYGSSPNGYIKKELPNWVQGVKVVASNEWYGYDSLLL